MNSSNKLFFGKMYEVKWEDSGTSHNDGWEDVDTIVSRAKIQMVYTCGYFIHEDEHALYFALTKDTEEKNFFGTQVIAKRSIEYIHRVVQSRGSAMEKDLKDWVRDEW